jgi:hypothetical protein
MRHFSEWFRQAKGGNRDAMDLTKDYPRSPREQLDGIMILPRAIDKARAQLEGKLGEYLYFGCHLNRMLFRTLGVTEDEFLQTVRSSPDDQGVLEWIREFVNPEPNSIEAMNQQLLHDGPQKPEEQKYFKDELDTIDPGNDKIKTWPDLIDLEEGRLPKESATAT